MAVRILSCIVAVAFMVGPAVRAAEPGKPTAAAAPLTIVKATWFVGRTSEDVTTHVAKLVKNDRLQIKIDPAVFGGDPVPAGRAARLVLVYKYGGREKTVSYKNGDEIWIARSGREKEIAAERLPEIRKAHPTGLVILCATYGQDDRIKDVTDQLQALVRDDSLTVPVGTEAFGDPDPLLSGERLRVIYHDGKELHDKAAENGETLQIGPSKLSVLARDGAIVDLGRKLAELRKTHSERILVLDARFGVFRNPNGTKDVTERAQAAVSGDSMTLPVNVATFGDPSPGSGGKKLRIHYAVGDEIKFVEQAEGTTLQVGKQVTAVRGPGGDAINIAARVAELRKKYPTGVLVLQARYGNGNRWRDVTDMLQAAASGDSLTVPVGEGAFGDPAPGAAGKVLQMTYAVGDETKTIEQGEGTVVQIGKRVTAIVGPGGGLLNIDQRIAELRKKYPSGVLVLYARYGEGNRWRDVTDLLQGAVSGDSLTAPVGDDAFGNPAPGAAGHRLQITYASGDEVKTVEQGEGTTLQVGPKRTAVTAIGGGVVNFQQRIAELRKKHPTGLLVLQARYGEGNRWRDLTDLLQSVVSGDSLTVPVGDDALGNPAPGQAGKRFQMTYAVGDEVKTIEQGEGSVVQIGPKRTSMVALDGGLINLDTRIAELRKDHPTGLLIVESRFGGGNRWMDITQRVQDAVKGKTVSIKASTEQFGDPNPGQSDKTMVTTYFDGERVVTVSTPNGATLKVDGNTVPTVGPGGVAMTTEQRVEAYRKVYGDGLIILDAQFGSGNRWGDVRELLQSHVVDDRLQVTVGDPHDWPDPAFGSIKEVRITYWDGRRIRTATQSEQSKLDLRGVKPDALKGIAPLPAFAAEGQRIEHAFGGKGTFKLEEGPAGATLSPDGKLSWTPAADQVGRQDLRYSVTVDGKAYVSTARIEVVGKELAKQAGNDLTKLGSLLRLDLGAGPVTYAPGLGWKTGLLLRADELIIVNGDGTSVQRRMKLGKQYTHIAERERYFVALSNEPKALDLLDKTTLKPTKSIKLPYRALTDLVVHPTKALSYVAVEDPGERAARYRVVVVDEASGDAREPENLIGRTLAIDPTGTRLYTGYQDVYQRGVHLFMNPDGRIWDTPTYGNIDILFVYNLRDAVHPRIQAYKESPGAGGSGLRVSTDGRRLTYLSHSGYPAGSGAIPGWDPTDLEKKPVTYECKGKAGTGRMSYHPTLPLVVVPAENGVLLFGRETADEEKDRVHLPAAATDGAKIEDAFFSPDGMNVLVLSRRGDVAQLYKAPLKLSAEEKGTAGRGVESRKPAQPQPPVLPPRKTPASKV